MTERAADAGLSRLLSLESVGDDSFIASGPPVGHGRIFGGQVASQSLRAACLTVGPGRSPHSLHAYFIRPGRPDRPLRFDVGRTRDGRSFSTRHVTACQDGEPILEMIASFQAPEAGHDWQPPPPPGIPGPDDPALPAPNFSINHARLFDLRLAVRRRHAEPDRRHPFWVRLREPIGDDPVLHACVLTYVSDMGVVTSARARDARARLEMAVSLDHAVWFHRSARVDEWLLYSAAPAANAGARGLANGTFRTADGTLVASVTQEALLRPRRDGQAP